MYPKFHCFTHFLIFVALGAAEIVGANAQSAAPPGQSAPPPAATQSAAPAASGTIRGHITDPTGALIPGASVTITNALGTQPVTVTADASGGYEVHGLAPGGYIVTATFDGFAPAQSPNIQLAAGQAKRVDIAMAIQVEQQNVVVTDDSPTVNTEAGGNASALVLKGKDLDALSDDPDELSSELSALAGPSAGPNGGQIFIDGFTGGQLPPKSAIREIRINQNPFSAEFDRLGYGRIEILTKPGTDKLHGQGFIQGNDDSFNTSNPFAKTIPSYHSIQFNGTVNGALSKSASFFFTAEQRNNQNDSIYDAQTAVLESSGEYVPGLVTGGVLSPQTRTNISPRIDFQLGKSNTFTLRYQFYRNAQSGQLGSNPYVLPTQATSSTSIENTVQFSDSIILTERAVNEIRFQYLRDTESTTPVNAAPSVSVPQFVTAGGSTEGSADDHQDHYELQDLTTMSLGKHAIKFGTRLRNNRDANYTNANFNGSFNFANLADYVGALNQTLGKPCPAGVVCAPNKLTYSAGGTAFTANVFDAAAFIQDDVRLNKFLTMSGGLRFESQNHISDHDDWGPRAAFAYALDGHKNSKQAKTVLRGGFGIFYDRLSLSDVLSATRQSLSPDSQKQYVITNPTCFSPTSLKDINLSTCGSSSAETNTIIQVAPNYHSPMTEQFGASIERQLTKSTTLTATYLHSFGVHALVTRDSNAYLPGTYLYGSETLTGVRPNPSLGIVEQFYPEAVFKQDQMIVNVNARISQNLSLLGFYNLTAANSDGGAGSNASNSYNISQDYGRASFASRNMVFAMANYMGPWALRFNPFLIAQAGRPFNVVTLNDLTGDNFFNSRPALAGTASCQGENTRYAQTSFGCLDTEPQSNDYTPIPINLGNGPAAVALNLRVSRAWGIGPKLVSNAANSQQQGGGPGGPGGGPGGGRGGPRGGGPGGGPGGGLGPGGLGGGGRGMGAMFAPTATGRKYTLTFSAMASNVFNNINYGTPSGAVAPVYDPTTNEMTPGSRFGQSLNLNGGPFSQGSASRVIRIQAVFAF